MEVVVNVVLSAKIYFRHLNEMCCLLTVLSPLVTAQQPELDI